MANTLRGCLQEQNERKRKAAEAAKAAEKVEKRVREENLEGDLLKWQGEPRT